MQYRCVHHLDVFGHPVPTFENFWSQFRDIKCRLTPLFKVYPLKLKVSVFSVNMTACCAKKMVTNFQVITGHSLNRLLWNVIAMTTSKYRKHVPCIYRAIETRVREMLFHGYFELSQTFTSVSIQQIDSPCVCSIIRPQMTSSQRRSQPPTQTFLGLSCGKLPRS